MIVDSEDLLMLSIAAAPLVLLFVWLVKPKSMFRTGLLITSLALFVLFLPYTTLYLGVPLAAFAPWLATSPQARDAAPLILVGAVALIIILIGIQLRKSLLRR